MSTYLFKSEPSEWSWADQVARGDDGEPWSGVRNYQARNVMRNMRIGDLGLFYHSQTEKACIGIVRVVRAAHPDPTDGTGSWVCVTVTAEEALPRPVTLAEIKDDPALSGMALVRNPRLSVQPVAAYEWDCILKIARS